MILPIFHSTDAGVSLEPQAHFKVIFPGKLIRLSGSSCENPENKISLLVIIINYY